MGGAKYRGILAHLASFLSNKFLSIGTILLRFVLDFYFFFFISLNFPAYSVKMELSRLLAANIDGRTQNTRYRQTQFQNLQSTLVEHLAEIQDAIRVDSGHTRQEVRAEVVLALQELRTHYVSLSLSKDLEVEYRIANGKDSADASRGLGIVYIAPSTHTLFFSVISALTASLAAGNCIVLEVSDGIEST